jgi:outer membrane receptor protein involved in Fe transport
MRLRVVVLVLFLGGTLSLAQSFRGGIDGTVTDSSGAALTGATVTAVNTGTGLTRSVQTGDTGDFNFPELPLGDYKVTVARTGFRTETQTAVTVGVTAHPHLEFKLIPGAVKETVEVTAEVPLVDVTTNNMGGTIEAKQVQDLPVNGGDFTKLLILVPGATGDNSGGADSPGSFGLFSANGSRGRSNNYLLDGTDMNDGYRNLPAINQGGVFGTPATILPVDALAEIPVISNAEAEYGRNSGAIVNMVTKSGTNTIHGSIYEYFRNNALDARNYFNAKTDPYTGLAERQNAFHNNQFGGSFGGPIIKDKTFYFLAYEGQRENGAMTFPNYVPTQQQMAAANCGGALPAGVNPVSANIVCNLQPWGPISSLPATGADGAYMLQSVNFRNRVDSVIGKIDQHIGSGDLLTGRYFFGDSDQSFPLGLLGGAAVPSYNTVTPTRVQILSLSYTHVISPKLLLEVRGGWNRFNEKFYPQDSSYDAATALGLNNNVAAMDGGLPLLRIGSPAVFCPSGCPFYSPVGANGSVPRGRVDTNWQFVTDASYTTGKHNWKWGFEFRRTFVNGFFDAGYRGVLSFATFDDFLAGSTGGQSSHQMAGDSRRYTHQNNYAFYVQDSWRVTPRLTANLGLRWDYYGVIGEKNGNLSIFNPTALAAQRVSQLYPKDYNNFGPRISLAWDVRGTGKTVVRAGYGIYYDAFSQDFFVGQLPWPTFNSGPAYNFLGVSDPWSIQESYSVNPGTFGLGVNAAGGCGASGVTVPNYAGYCADPVFSYDPTFGNDTFTVDQRMRTPYVQNWNLNVEQAINNRISWQIGYVGSKGTKLFHYIDINQTCPLNYSCPGVASGSNAYGYPAGMGYGYVLQFGSTAGSVYHSLQTSLQMRNWHGLSSVANYTWSHSIDNASDGQDYVPNATQPDNSFNPAAERANSNFDQRHRFTWNLTYEFPNADTMKWLRNGWQIDSVVTLSSGNPYNVNWGTESFPGDFNGTGEYYGRPDLVGNPFSGTGGLNILNLAAFAVPCTWDPVAGDCVAGTQHTGSLPRNAFVGPHFRAFDFSLVKSTKLGEKVTMQLRADFFNLLNHPNLANPLWPGFEVDMLHNGISNTGTGLGFLQPSATPDVGLGNPFLGGGGPRDIQLAVRFSF